MSGYRNYYDATFGRSTKKTPSEEKSSATSRIASKYGGSLTAAGYQRDTSAVRDTGYSSRSDASRYKSSLEKKETSHPPISYRGLSRSGARSRDPSPVLDKSDKSSSSSSYNYNRLYPKTYTRSVSRERLEPPASTIPKYTGRSSSSKDDVISKYTGSSSSRTSLSREDLSVPKYGGRSSLSKDDAVPKYAGRSSINKDEGLSRYKSTSSREDLSSGSQKYITSRFLPKNSVEKSYTAYTRPSTIRSHETSRKNRELLSVLQAQQEHERSRPTSRCSSTPLDETHHKISAEAPRKEVVEMEVVNVVSRGTSPTPSGQNNGAARSRRAEIAKIIEKQITRPKLRSMVDKEVQSDRLDDTSKNSRFAGGSRISATPWSSILDMKFTSPSDKKQANKQKAESPKSISRTSSTKSVTHASSKSDSKHKDSKSPSPSPGMSNKASPSPPKSTKLPPPIPKSENNNNTKSLHSINIANKDFRKSILNMNPDGSFKKKLGRRSNSASSAESESDVQPSEATDVSENLASCKSYHKTANSSSSKLPQRIQGDKVSQRSRRSPSSDTSSSTTVSEDNEKKNEVKKLQSVASSRTSLASAEELSVDKSPKPPPSPRSKTENSPKSEAEAKSFLMRALAPVTSLFKNRSYQDSSEKVNWMDPSQSDGKVKAELQPTAPFKRTESDEKTWWLDDTSASCSLPLDSECINPAEEDKPKKPFIRHVESGEIPWWLDQNAEVPEGVQTYPDYQPKHRTDHSDSQKGWWLSSESAKGDSGPNSNIMDAEYQERHKIRHIDSGERSWWLSSSENIPEMVQPQQPITVPDEKPKYAIRHQDSGEKAWWLQNKSEEDDFDSHQIPLGDRASPEGLEMPMVDSTAEGRLSPYDNVCLSGQKRTKRPSNISFFISKHTNIDEILGGSGQMWSPLMSRVFGYHEEGGAGDGRMEVDGGQARILQAARVDNIGGFPKTFSPYGKNCGDFTTRDMPSVLDSCGYPTIHPHQGTKRWAAISVHLDLFSIV